MSALGTTQADCARQLQVQFCWAPGELREVRVLDGKAKRRALVDSPAAAVRFAAAQPRGAGVYVTMNALAPSAEGRFAADVDVPRRVRFALDFDPVRQAGTPATDAQVQAAGAMAADVDRFLLSRGWPVPVRMESGNGVHRYWRVDLPADSAAPRALLKALQARFGTDQVAVDVTIHNPARIMRAAGCWNCKGAEAPDAPYRLARVTDAGEQDAPALAGADFATVLDALGVPVASVPVVRPRAEAVREGGPRLDVDAWLARHGIAHRGARAWRCQDGNGSRWVLEACPFNAAHDRGEACVTQSASGAVAFRCQHHSCAMQGWRELRELKDGPRRHVLDMFVDGCGRTLRAASEVDHAD